MSDPSPVAVDFDPFALGEITQSVPLTAPQREIWAAVLLGGEAANLAYNEANSVSLHGPLDVGALSSALTTLVARHDMLRATFAANGSATLIAEHGALALEQIDLRREHDPESAYRALTTRAVATPFDLVRGPLCRLTLVQLGADHHCLLWVAHHLVVDGWSYGTLLHELGRLYDGALGGLCELDSPESYADYAREREASASTAQQSLAYWMSVYEGEVPALELPLDHTRPDLRTYRAARVDHELPAELITALRTLAKAQRTSLLQVLLSTFQTLLARLTRQWDVVVGLSAAGQASAGRPGLVGHAVSYLPLRAQLHADMPFTELLTQTKHRVGEALDHQDVTFGTLLQHLSLPRDPSRVPLCPVSFNLETGYRQSGFSGLTVSARSVPRCNEAFELFVNVVDQGTTLLLETQLNLDLFAPQAVQQWLLSFETLLRGVVSAPSTTLSALPLLSDAQREHILRTCSDTACEVPFTALHHFFEQRVDRDPTRTAALFEGTSVSYAELEWRSNQLASALIARGAAPEAIVGVCLPRSLDMVVALLGVLKAGAAYLPLDPTYPAERLSHMCRDAGVSLVVSCSSTVEALSHARDVSTVLLDVHRDELARQPNTRPNIGTRPEQLAYVLYTSGSTGKPKAVLVEHRNVANFLAGMAQQLDLATPGGWLCATSIGFDISVLEIFGALAHGFTLILHSDESEPAYALAELLTLPEVTHFQCTPSQARLLLAEPRACRALGSLHELLVGGEALPVDLARELRSLLSNGRLFNMYGPTETTIWSTVHPVEEAEGSVPIGRPIANTQLYILDDRGELCARGVVGELHIGGAGVSRGYHLRPELTSERFLRNPFVGGSATTPARMYKTGDLVRQRLDGELVFVCRNDQQVKLRGYRIELGEIELALRSHPELDEAVVVARAERGRDVRLVAYLVASAQPTIPELKTFLTRAGLPEYMLPQTFVLLSELPRTPNGKLDRNALPVPEQDRSLGTGSYSAPQGELEQKVADAWSIVLGLARVGRHENFFDLGGHSLLVVRLAEELAHRIGRTVAIPDLFRFPTVHSFAASLPSGSASPSGIVSQAEGEKRGSERRDWQRRVTGRRG